MIFSLIISVDYFFGNPVKSNTDNTGIKGNFFDLKKKSKFKSIIFGFEWYFIFIIF